MPTPTAATLASSVQGLALRVTALNSDGTAVTGTSSAYTMNRFVTAQFTPVYAGSNNIRQQLANGNFAVTFQTSDVFQNINVTLHIAGPDPQFNQIAIGGTILTDTGGAVVGWKPTATGQIDQPNGVALELWSFAISRSPPAARELRKLPVPDEADQIEQAVPDLPKDLSVHDTLEWVGGDKRKAQKALDAENKGGGARTTLVTELGRLLNDETGAGVVSNE